MSSSLIKPLASSAVVAVILYLVTSFLSIELSSGIALAIGAIVGGVAATFAGSGNASASGETLARKTLYVGNLPYKASEGAVRALFAEYGEVISVRLMRDRQTGKRKGFGFVEMDEAGASKAIDALNEFEFQQRTLKVREAKDKTKQTEQNEELAVIN